MVAAKRSTEPVEIAERLADGRPLGPPETVALSQGIVLRLKAIPPELIREAASRVTKPPVPVVWIADKEREEENPHHPDYIEAMAVYERDVSEATSNVAIALGTECESVPEGYYSPDDDGWIADLEDAGIAVTEAQRTRRVARYLAWMRLYAMATAGDIALVILYTRMSYALLGSEVEHALAAFRGDARWRADRDAKAAEDGKDGDHVPRVRGGHRAGDRGA